MQHYLIIILSTVLSFCSFGQSKRKNCNCPEVNYIKVSDVSYQTIPDTSFYFTNENTIILCGYKDTETVKGKTLFGEFILAVCGQDTIIDFWDATKTCRLHTINDTLFVEELKSLPTGKNLNYRHTVWTIEKLYFVNGRIVRKLSPNRNIRKYTTDEIKRVVKEFQTTPNSKENLEKAQILFDKLFVATISGDKEARKYFTAFKSKFPYLGEHFNEEYN